MASTDMGMSVRVSRSQDLNTAADLELNAAGSPPAYRITSAGIGPGTMTWRRETVTSPLVAGRVLLSAVKDVQTVTLKVRVRATSYVELEQRINDLLAAFEQRSYSMRISYGGVTKAWTCEPADQAIGDQGVFVEGDLRGFQQVVTLMVPRSPVPIAGGY